MQSHQEIAIMASKFKVVNMSEKYKTIDLFAGIGGIRLGFEKTGQTENVFSAEVNPWACKTYEFNHGEDPSCDVTKIDEHSLPDFDILLAGFPCQAFSIAGKRGGFEDTRGTLFFDVARIIKAKEPKAFLLENVKGLVNHDKGRTFKTILNTLREDLGYNVHYQMINARDHGVPQNRDRIYIVGFMDDVDFKFPSASGKPTRLGDILEQNVDPKYTLSDKLWAGHQRRKAEHIAKGNGFGYSLFDEYSPYTSTISARYGKDGSEILIKNGDNNPRKLTPREALRLQGYPDSFEIPVSDTQIYKQCGNSVCVNVIEKIATNMVNALNMNL